MDAEELRYADNSFDLAVGFGVLHHVIKYPRAGSQLSRVLSPGGRAVFHETLWDNPLINLARRFTGEHADAGDAHLTDKNIREFFRDFGQVRLEKRHLLYMLKRLAKLPPPDLNAPPRPAPILAIGEVDRPRDSPLPSNAPALAGKSLFIFINVLRRLGVAEMLRRPSIKFSWHDSALRSMLSPRKFCARQDPLNKRIVYARSLEFRN